MVISKRSPLYFRLITVFLVFTFSLSFKVLTQLAQPVETKADTFISREDAVKFALESFKPSTKSKIEKAELVYDRKGSPWYTVTFVTKNEDTQENFVEKTVVLSPYDGTITRNAEILREFDAQLSFGEAVESALKQDGRREEYQIDKDTAYYGFKNDNHYFKVDLERVDGGSTTSFVRAYFIDDYSDDKWYLVDFCKVAMVSDLETPFWEKRLVINAFDGVASKDVTILKNFAAGAGDLPDDVNPNTKEIYSPFIQFFGDLVGYLVVIGVPIALIALAFRKKLRKFETIDIIFGLGSIIQFILVFIFIDWAIFLLVSMIGTVTSWVTTKYFVGSHVLNPNKITVINKKKLPKFSDVGGLQEVKEELRNTIGLMISQKNKMKNLKIDYNGVLLYGPPGTGKSFLAKATAGEFGLNFISLKVSDLVGIYMGSSSKNIDTAFKAAIKNAPCLLLFDEFDAIARERGVDITDVENARVVDQLLQCLEAVRQHSNEVLIFAATNEQKKLDEAVIRAGRFDKHIRISLPDNEARRAIFNVKLKEKGLDASSFDLEELSMRTNGMSAADIATIIDKAMLLLISSSGKKLTQEHLCEAISNYRDKYKPNVEKKSWSDLILQDDVLLELKRLVKIVEKPEIIQKLGINSPKGILLYGPPGTGKTTIAKVIANESDASFFSISQADIFSKWLGESERNVKNIFDEARKHKPSIIFIDEIDAILTKRSDDSTGYWGDKIVNQILQEIDGMNDTSSCFIIGATNAPDKIDSALLRGGRLSAQIEIPLPSEDERVKLFDLFLHNTPKSKDCNTRELAALSEGYSGAEIKEICHSAIFDAFDRYGENVNEIAQSELVASIQKYKKTSKIYKVPGYFKNNWGMNQLSVQEIAQSFLETVVVVINIDKKNKETSFGSGALISESGIIVTNYHVVEKAKKLKVSFVDGNENEVQKVIGISKKEDIAVLKISGSKFKCAKLGDSDKAAVGEKVVAIGNPEGLLHSVSEGIISAKRVIDDVEVIQITAPVSHGSSGGPVFNMRGEIIGIAKAIFVVGQNLNLAVPANRISALLENASDIAFELL